MTKPSPTTSKPWRRRSPAPCHGRWPTRHVAPPAKARCKPAASNCRADAAALHGRVDGHPAQLDRRTSVAARERLRRPRRRWRRGRRCGAAPRCAVTGIARRRPTRTSSTACRCAARRRAAGGSRSAVSSTISTAAQIGHPHDAIGHRGRLGAIVGRPARTSSPSPAGSPPARRPGGRAAHGRARSAARRAAAPAVPAPASGPAPPASPRRR